MKQYKNLWEHNLFFPTAMWLLSRFFILNAMLLIAPLLPAPANGIKATVDLGVFSAWDTGWYHSIVTTGYQYGTDDRPYSVAFFPLFPLLVRITMNLGLPFELAGILVNNLAFLGALIVLFTWMKERHGIGIARWTTAVLAWCPLSLFCTVIYTEGVYLLFSTAALRAFDKKQYFWTAIWGTFATASRPTGIALVPAFVFAVWKERRGAIALLASLAAGGGLFLYSMYCLLRFDDALAFVNAQKAWRPSLGFDWFRWGKMIAQIVVGGANWKAGKIVDPWHPLIVVIIIGCGYLLWHFHKKLGRAKVDYGFGALAFFLWLLAGDPLTNAVMIFGGIYLLWRLRAELNLITITYGFCGIGLLLASGGTISLNRLAYGIVSLSVVLGALLERYPRWGYMVMGFFLLLLTSFSVRFAQDLWVA
jgi:Gpi18-like mannosyltransferase